MTALAMMTMVIAAGAAVDLSRGHALQSHVGSTLDAATLAAANASINVPCDVDTSDLTLDKPNSLGSWVNDQGTKYFNMNLPSQYLGSTAVTGLQFVLSPPDSESSGGTYVTGSSSTTLPNSFLQIAGQSGIPVSTCSQVHIPLNGDLGTSPTATSPHVHSDPTTGFYTPGAGQLAAANNGVQSLQINVAAPANGTTTPLPTLDVNGDVMSESGHFITNYSNGALVLDAGPASNGVAGFYFRADSKIGVRGPNINAVEGTDYNTLMFIKSNGNMGIGTITPLAPLHIADTAGTTIDNGRPSLLIEETSSDLSSPRIGLVDTSLGDVSNAPAWIIDNNTDYFRIFRQPNITTSGAYNQYPIGFIMDNKGNTGIGTPNTTQSNPNILSAHGNWTPLGTLDIEKTGGSATLCLNGSCVTSIPGADKVLASSVSPPVAANPSSYASTQDDQHVNTGNIAHVKQAVFNSIGSWNAAVGGAFGGSCQLSKTSDVVSLMAKQPCAGAACTTVFGTTAVTGSFNGLCTGGEPWNCPQGGEIGVAVACVYADWESVPAPK